MLFAKTEKVQDKEIRTGEGGGGGGGRREGGNCVRVLFLLLYVVQTPTLPPFCFPSMWLSAADPFPCFMHLETMDFPFPQCLISDPWRDGHLDISLFKLAKHATEAD